MHDAACVVPGDLQIRRRRDLRGLQIKEMQRRPLQFRRRHHCPPGNVDPVANRRDHGVERPPRKPGVKQRLIQKMPQPPPLVKAQPSARDAIQRRGKRIPMRLPRRLPARKRRRPQSPIRTRHQRSPHRHRRRLDTPIGICHRKLKSPAECLIQPPPGVQAVDIEIRRQRLMLRRHEMPPLLPHPPHGIRRPGQRRIVQERLRRLIGQLCKPSRYRGVDFRDLAPSVAVHASSAFTASFIASSAERQPRYESRWPSRAVRRLPASKYPPDRLWWSFAAYRETRQDRLERLLELRVVVGAECTEIGCEGPTVA